MENSWFDKNQKKTLIILAFIIITLIISGVELFLRLKGEKPYSNVKVVNELIVDDSYVTDDEGVFKANNRSKKWPENLINADGFRSIEFGKNKTDQKKILFLGDSFTWGINAKPIHNCFVDLVANHGYTAYNTGMPAVGPKQYAYLAQKYIPLLKPDIVAVMFCMENDFYDNDRLIPNKSSFYVTNAGWIIAFDRKGNFLSTPQEAYDYYIGNGTKTDKIKTDKSAIKRVLKATMIGRRVLSLMGSKKEQNELSDKQEADSDTTKLNIKDINIECLSRIKKISEKYNAVFKLFLIPAHPKKEALHNSIKKNLSCLSHLNPLVPEFITINDYHKLPGGHFNNSGHLKYANFIISKIE